MISALAPISMKKVTSILALKNSRSQQPRQPTILGANKSADSKTPLRKALRPVLENIRTTVSGIREHTISSFLTIKPKHKLQAKVPKKHLAYRIQRQDQSNSEIFDQV